MEKYLHLTGWPVKITVDDVITGIGHEHDENF
jgi:hypothetical protein